MEKKYVRILLILIIVIAVCAIYFFAGPGYTGMASTSSQLGNFSVGISTFVSCVWSDAGTAVSFGTNLDPGMNGVNATLNYDLTGNGTAYNVTNSGLSNVEVNITIKGQSLVSSANIIGIGNITWQSNSTIANGSNMIVTNAIALGTDYDTTNKVGASIAKSSTVHYRFWITIPNLTVAGDYRGNYTMQCSQA